MKFIHFSFHEFKCQKALINRDSVTRRANNKMVRIAAIIIKNLMCVGARQCVMQFISIIPLTPKTTLLEECGGDCRCPQQNAQPAGHSHRVGVRHPVKEHISRAPSSGVGPIAKGCLMSALPFLQGSSHYEDKDKALGNHRELCWRESHFLLYVFEEVHFFFFFFT